VHAFCDVCVCDEWQTDLSGVEGNDALAVRRDKGVEAGSVRLFVPVAPVMEVRRPAQETRTDHQLRRFRKCISATVTHSQAERVSDDTFSSVFRENTTSGSGLSSIHLRLPTAAFISPASW
jgi:hypothetical protein